MSQFDEWEKREKNKGRFHFKIFENAKPWHYVLLIILFVIATQLAKSKQSKFVWIGLGVFLIGIGMLIFEVTRPYCGFAIGFGFGMISSGFQ